MDTVNTIELGDESIYPDEQVLKSVLGQSYAAYQALLDLYQQHGLTHEWRYYHDGKAWLCKVQKGKRTIIWMSAWKGFMQATAYIPLRIISEVYALPLKSATIEGFKRTKDVGKSKPCIFEVHSSEVLEDLETVMLYKIKAR